MTTKTLAGQRILLTGASGFLGRHLAPRLQTHSDQVFALARNEASQKRLQDTWPAEKIVPLLDSESSLEKQKFDLIVHLATSYGRRGETREEIFAANLTLPLQVKNRFLRPQGLLINMATALPKELNDYAASKWQLVEELEASRTRTLNLVLEQFYGPGDGTFVSFLLDQLNREVPEVAMTQGRQKRDFIYIDDLIDAIEVALGAFAPADFLREDLSIGSGSAFSIREIVATLCEVYQDLRGSYSTTFHWGARPERKGETPLSLANLEKISHLGWSPKFSLRQGLRKTVQNTPLSNSQS